MADSKVTDIRINELLHDAAAAGDDKMAAICCRALTGSRSAWAECERVIRAAEAMRDSTRSA